jgi:GrpB-like predicted nucleotidyltransferase (UPF0157 family)
VDRIDEPIALVAYDADWPAHFAREAARLRAGLGDAVHAIEHIGSTAVVGLAAKPVVDLMIGVQDLDRTDHLAHQLGLLDYEDCGGAAGRRYFRKRGNSQHFNVQLMGYGSPQWDANILFRDYLRADGDAAKRYADGKRAAASVAPTLLAYSRLKTPIIEELLRRGHR